MAKYNFAEDDWFDDSESVSPRVSSSLELVAGDWATRLAMADPFPHREALSMSAACLHTMVIDAIDQGDFSRIQIGAASTSWRCRVRSWSDRFPLLSPQFIKKMVLPMWSEAGYQSLLTISSCEVSAKLLRHRPRIDEDRVICVAGLPVGLRLTEIVELAPEPSLTRLMGRLYNDCSDKYGFMEKLIKARDVEDLWDKARDHIIDNKIVLPKGPDLLSLGLKQLRTMTDFHVAGMEMNNCLSMRYDPAAVGKEAFYTGLVDGCQIAIAVSRDLSGQLIATEIETHDNVEVPEKIINKLSAMLFRKGITVKLQEQCPEIIEVDKHMADIRKCSRDVEDSISALLALSDDR
ncbi:hypothetical protein [Hyphobacterium sp.]|uniref:hypothetical protein n=1 Tax=Hyphobacterium sp. TaxID=2004662 RepID=UPI003BAD3CA3